MKTLKEYMENKNKIERLTEFLNDNGEWQTEYIDHKDYIGNFFDLVEIANHFDEEGTPGWIREDINNGGDVSVLDLVLVSNHFDETW